MINGPSEGRAGLLDRAGLIRALDALSARLAARGVRASIHIAGGACMILAHQRARATQDLDALSIDERDCVLSAARAVAAEQGLTAQWVNDDVRDLYFHTSMSLADTQPLEALYDSPALVVTGAPASHLLAMKAQACRDSDLEDIALLLRHLGVATLDEIRDVHAAVFPYDSLSPAKEERLRQVLREVLAGGGVDQRQPFRATRPPRRRQDGGSRRLHDDARS